MTDQEIHVEGKRRVQRSNPSISDQQWAAWLTNSLSAGATIVLTLDGCLAAHPRRAAPCACDSAAIVTDGGAS